MGSAARTAARELERLLPKQSARLTLVNDVNFLLYTPFLPEAAAGHAGAAPRRHAAARHPEAHLPAARRGRPATTRRRARSSCATHEGEAERAALRPAAARARLGLAGRCRCPGLAEHAIGFKSLADAIWLRNHVIETLEAANATEDPARREELLTYVFVGGGYAGLEALAELQDFAADAMDRYPRARLHGMRWILVEATDRVLPEIDRRARRLRAARAARPRDRHPPRDARSRRSTADSARALDRRDAADPDRRLDRRASRRTRASRTLGAAARRARPRPGRRAPARRGHGRRLGDRRLRRGARPAGGGPPARRPPSTRSARARRSARNVAAELGVGDGRAVQLPQPRGVRQPRPLQGGRPDRRPARSAASPPGGWPAPTT